MTREKPVTVTVAGGGPTKQTAVKPGDTPRDVLARIVENNPDQFDLRSGTRQRFDPDTDVFHNVEKGDTLYTATKPVVGVRNATT